MSRLYVGFRALGLVTNDVPFSIQARGSTHFLTSCIEKSFQIYHLEKMQLLFVGDSNAIITALKSFKDFTFCAIDSGIQVFIRSTLETTLTHDSTFEITKLDILGDLLLATCTDNCIRIWTISTRKFHSLISFPFQISFMIHPSTYLNKILIASSTGIMQLWNINTMYLLLI